MSYGKSCVLAEVLSEERRAGAATMQEPESSHASELVSIICEMSRDRTDSEALARPKAAIQCSRMEAGPG